MLMFGTKNEKPATREERVAAKVRVSVARALAAANGRVASALELRERRAKLLRDAMTGDVDALSRFFNASDRNHERQANGYIAEFENILRAAWANAGQAVAEEDAKAEAERLAAEARAKAAAEEKEQ